jgi:hypothetical protein
MRFPHDHTHLPQLMWVVDLNTLDTTRSSLKDMQSCMKHHLDSGKPEHKTHGTTCRRGHTPRPLQF